MFNNQTNVQYYYDEECSCSSCECSNFPDENRLMNIAHIYKIIDQSYTKLPLLYKSIKQIKLDTDFILSVNDYLDRLKSNIYKDLIRRETLLRNGKNHTRNLISLIRCICKISYEQSNQIEKQSALYTMTAIDYILQNHFPQKKSLFNYILNEYISMWLHENLRIIQEDFSIIVENEIDNNFFSLCTCIFNKLESICAINWERLQMIQNYRLTHFDQLLKPTSIKLETNKDFILLFGEPLQLIMKKSEIPVTLLYSNRTHNELINIDEIHNTFKKCIAKVLHDNFNEEDIRQRITPSAEIMTSALILEKPTWNVIYETPTQLIKPLLLPRIPSSNVFDKQLSDLKLIVSQYQTISTSMQIKSKQNDTSSSIHTHQSSSQSKISVSHSQTSTKMNSSNEPTSSSLTAIVARKSELQRSNILSTNHPQQDNSTTTDSKAVLDVEINALINFLTKLANSSSMYQRETTLPLVEQLDSYLKETNIDPNIIIEKIRTSPSQSSFNVNDPLFLAEFTRVLRKELEDAQILREIDRRQLNQDDSQNIGYLSFETRNILKIPKINTAAGDNIEQNRIFIEITHDPSKCSSNHDVYHSCISSPLHQQFNHNCSFKSDNQFQQQWYWIRSNENSLSKDCLITSNSLSCTEKSSDKNTYSITIEHNEEFR